MNNITGLGSEGIGVVYKKNSDGTPDTTTIEFIHWTGTGVNSVTLTDTGDRGVTGSYNGAQAHSNGDTFEVWVHSSYYLYTPLSNLVNTITGALDTTKVADLSTAQTLINKILTSPKIGTAITDTNSNEMISFSPQASAVNEITITNSATGNAPIVSSSGDDATIDLQLRGKGAGMIDEDKRKLTTTPASDHQFSGTVIQIAATQAQNFGDICYIASTGKASLAKADAIANASGLVMCVDASVAQDATGNYMILGVARDDTWNWTVGGLIYLSTTGTTGNTPTQTAPSGTNNVIQVLGVATHADRMFFNPSLVQVEHT